MIYSHKQGKTKRAFRGHATTRCFHCTTFLVSNQNGILEPKNSWTGSFNKNKQRQRDMTVSQSYLKKSVRCLTVPVLV